MDFLREIAELWRQFGNKIKNVSKHFDSCHAESQEKIADNSNGLFDLAEAVSDNSDGEYDLAEIVSDLSDQVSALQEELNALKNNATEENEDA